MYMYMYMYIYTCTCIHGYIQKEEERKRQREGERTYLHNIIYVLMQNKHQVKFHKNEMIHKGAICSSTSIYYIIPFVLHVYNYAYIYICTYTHVYV